MLKGKNVVITGGGRGIGREIAIKCAKNGANLCLIARTASELEETLILCSKFKGKYFYKIADISNEIEFESVCSDILNNIGYADVLINNAGIQSPIGPFFCVSLSEWKKNIGVNLLGAIYASYFFIPSMIKRKHGKIINFSGGGAVSSRPNFSAYGAAKTAVVRFTEILADELRQNNIDVNAIAPGAINTKMLDEILSAENMAGNEYKAAIERKKRGGDNIKFAVDLVCFLASNASDGISGKLISAQWDPWQDENFQKLLRSEKDLAALRRIDNKVFYKKEKA